MPTDNSGGTPSASLGAGVHWGGQVLSREEIAQVAYQAGFRGEALVSMVGIAIRESGGAAQLYVNRPSTGDWSYGLWGLNVGKNMSMWSEYKNMGFSSPDELRTPLGNAKAAKALYDHYGLYPWGGYKGMSGTYGTDLNKARAAVNNAASQGLLGQSWNDGTAAQQSTGQTPSSGGGGGSSASANTNTVAAAAQAQPVQLPAGGQVFGIEGVGVSVLYDLGNGVSIHFGIPWFDSSRVAYDHAAVQSISQADWANLTANGVYGGDADGLKNVQATYGSFQKFWESVLAQTIGFNNPASKDQSVLKVLAEFASRPDMSQAELQNRLKATPYWNTLTVAQQQWNDLPEAERTSQRNDMAGRMIDTIFQFMGVRTDWNDPLIAGSLDDVASGKIGFGVWTEQIKQAAQKNPESPFSRQIRDEQVAQRTHPIDIENTQKNIKDQLRRWGLHWDAGTIGYWASQIVDKFWSDDDLLEQIKDQAKALYPTKDREIETTTYAQPWIQSYNQLMEDSGDVMTPQVQQAMQSGTILFDFQKQLKSDPKWMSTQNGQDSMYQTMQKVNEAFGFRK